MYIAAAVNVKSRLLPAVTGLRSALAAKADDWRDIVKNGRTHMQGTTPITFGQDGPPMPECANDNVERIEGRAERYVPARARRHRGSIGFNAAPGFAE